MASMPPQSAQPERAPVAFTEADEQHAVLTFAGALDAHALPELEELLSDRRLRQAGTWVWDMSSVQRIDLACASPCSARSPVRRKLSPSPSTGPAVPFSAPCGMPVSTSW